MPVNIRVKSYFPKEQPLTWFELDRVEAEGGSWFDDKEASVLNCGKWVQKTLQRSSGSMRSGRWRFRDCWSASFFALPVILLPMYAQGFQGSAEQTHFHLSPRSVAVQPITTSAMLDRLDGLCRFTLQWQDASGAVIDPYLHREFQYATPYFAFAVGTLMAAGRSRDLLPHGIAAMERATIQFVRSTWTATGRRTSDSIMTAVS